MAVRTNGQHTTCLSAQAHQAMPAAGTSPTLNFSPDRVTVMHAVTGHLGSPANPSSTLHTKSHPPSPAFDKQSPSLFNASIPSATLLCHVICQAPQIQGSPLHPALPPPVPPKARQLPPPAAAHQDARPPPRSHQLVPKLLPDLSPHFTANTPIQQECTQFSSCPPRSNDQLKDK